MGISEDILEVEDICETDWVKNFEFHDAEAFRQDIYQTILSTVNQPNSSSQVTLK